MLIKAIDIPRNDPIYKISNPKVVQSEAYSLISPNAIIYKSTKKGKKYMIVNPETKKFVHFGSMMEDFTFHQNNKRLANFLARNSKWKDYPKYSPAYLSYYLLW